MVNSTTVQKLIEMRLTAMVESFRNQLVDSNFNSLSFEERFGLIVDTEWSRRKNNQISFLR